MCKVDDKCVTMESILKSSLMLCLKKVLILMYTFQNNRLWTSLGTMNQFQELKLITNNDKTSRNKISIYLSTSSK